MHDLLLRKSSGTFELIVWNERAEGSDTVTVTLGETHQWVKLYDPTLGVTPIDILTGTRSILLTLSDQPVILEME